MTKTRAIALTVFVIWQAGFIAVMSAYFVWIPRVFDNFSETVQREYDAQQTATAAADNPMLAVHSLSCVETSVTSIHITGNITNTGVARSAAATVVIVGIAPNGDAAGTFGSYHAPGLNPDQAVSFDLNKPTIANALTCRAEVWVSGRRAQSLGEPSATIFHF